MSMKYQPMHGPSCRKLCTAAARPPQAQANFKVRQGSRTCSHCAHMSHMMLKGLQPGGGLWHLR